ncbi:MAG: hypothetical protein JWM03_1045 [Rhodocyclales bacterium]|nr:hypothetical protein [Rhodocyclales bacterium]MDB5888173.1 hypothetical protein [Rhodocyclales bacterium]
MPFRSVHAALKFALKLYSNKMMIMDEHIARQYKTIAAMADGVATSTILSTKTKTVTG